MPLINYYNLPLELPRNEASITEQLLSVNPALADPKIRRYAACCLLDEGLNALPEDAIEPALLQPDHVPAKLNIALGRKASTAWARLKNCLLLVAGFTDACNLSEEAFEAMLGSAAEDFLAMLDADFGVSVSAVISLPFLELSECESAVRDALVIADFARFIEEPVNVADASYYRGMQQLLSRQNPEYRLVNYERAFIAALLGGNFVHAGLIMQKLLIAHLCDPCYVFPSMRASMANIARLAMAMVVIDPKALSNQDDRFLTLQWDMQNCETLSDMKRYIHQFIQLVEEYAAREKEQRSADCKMQHIVDFLNENYKNPLLDAVMVSDRFDITPSYLSRAFKEHTGVNLSTYLQTVRLTAAKALLTGSDMTIERIAAEVGYSGGQNLLRLFKKLEGVNPSVYKNLAHGTTDKTEVKN